MEMAGIMRHVGKTRRVSEESPEEERINAIRSIALNIKKLKQNIKSNPDDPQNIVMVFDVYDLIKNNLPREEYVVGKDLITRKEVLKSLLDASVLPEKTFKDEKSSGWHDYKELKGRTIDDLRRDGFSMQRMKGVVGGKEIETDWYHLLEIIIEDYLGKRFETGEMVKPRSRKERMAEGSKAEEEVFYFGADGEPYRTFINVPADGIIQKAFWKTNKYKVVGQHPDDPERKAILIKRVGPSQKPQWSKDGVPQRPQFEIVFDGTIDEVRDSVNHEEAKKAYEAKYPRENPKYAAFYRSGRQSKQDEDFQE